MHSIIRDIFFMINTAASERINYLDGMRGFAALAVAIMHFPIDNWFTNNPFFVNSYLAVDLFFVLSGYIIAKLYYAQSDQLKFLRHRFARIAPIFYLTLFIGIVLEVMKFVFPDIASSGPFEGQNTLSSLLLEITAIHALPFVTNTSFNPPNWSISAEMFAYLLFAALMKVAYPRRILIWLTIFLMCALYFPNVLQLNDAHGLAIYRCLFGFSAGVLIWYCLDQLPMVQKWLPRISNIGFGGATFFLGFYIYQGGLDFLPPAVIFGLYLLVAFQSDCSLREHLFSNRIAIFLGEISLSLYLIHFFIAMRFEEINLLLVDDLDNPLLLVLAYLFVVIVVSTMLNKYFEKPARILLR